MTHVAAPLSPSLPLPETGRGNKSVPRHVSCAPEAVRRHKAGYHALVAFKAEHVGCSFDVLVETGQYGNIISRPVGPFRTMHAMSEPSPMFWRMFFEVYESLPRQGPGNRTCAAKALALCCDLPPSPMVLDLGCGVGGQTFHLAEMTSGCIIAIDNHAPFIERLRATVTGRGLARRIRPIVADMARPGLAPASFDLVWSEGALYNIGIDNALCICHRLLRPGGCLVFTDAVWRKQNPPSEVKATFDMDYPAMGRISDALTTIERSGFSLIGHFTLPDAAWWDDFYGPMETRIEELRGKYADDYEALTVLDQLAQEPEMHRKHSDCFAYECFVARRKG